MSTLALKNENKKTADKHPLPHLSGFGRVLPGLALTGVIILVAIVSLILTPFLGPFAPVLFYGVNGWLLGREFFQMAARRHLSEERARALRQANAKFERRFRAMEALAAEQGTDFAALDLDAQEALWQAVKKKEPRG